MVKCVGFDTASDFTAGTSSSVSGILQAGGTTETRALRDTTQSASGGGSLKFIIPAVAAADTSGSYFTNFSNDLSVQFDSGQEFFVQWRQRFSPEFIANQYEGGGGFKQTIIGTGDTPGNVNWSCTDLEIVTANFQQKGFPILYNSCSGSTSHPAYDGFYEPYGAYDFKIQNARPSPLCLYSQKSSNYFAPSGNCFGYVANEWMTFQIQVKVGQRSGDEFKNSYVTLWGAREGKASEPIITWGPYNLSAGAAGTNQKFGKVWLVPYNTGKTANSSYPIAYTWYDELIISKTKIADPK